MSWLSEAVLGIGIFGIGGGLLFAGLGVWGLYRMPDVYTRMHAATKAVTLGSSMTLLGVAVLSPLDVALKAAGITAFLFLTTPVAALALARAAHRRGEPKSERTLLDELAEPPAKE
jgi:multicomponent Na+:H+ antiporter subunit G